MPLGVLRKAQLIDFDLREGSSPLMLVRSELNAHVAAAIIAQEARAEGAGPQELATARPLLERIASADRAAGQDAFDHLFAGDGGGPFDAGGAAWTIAEQLLESYVLLVELPETGSRRRLIRFATDQLVGVRDERGRSPSGSASSAPRSCSTSPASTRRPPTTPRSSSRRAAP